MKLDVNTIVVSAVGIAAGLALYNGFVVPMIAQWRGSA